MNFGPDELEDRAVLESVRARMELALDEPSPRVEALMQRLEAHGGSAWADVVFERTLGRADGVVARVALHFRALLRVAADEPDEDARFLLACAIAAAHVVERGALPARDEAQAPESDEALQSVASANVGPEDMLDLASELSEDWCQLFARAAQILRGEETEEPYDDGALRSERVGGYRLMEPLGRGAFGTVYRAIQPDLGRQVALKLLRPEVFSTQAERRFLEEGRILSSLSHPGIAILYQAGFDRHLGIRLPFLAMELVRGKSIRRYAEDKELGVHARVRLFIQACDALQHAHESGVVHRDVHPGNLLVREDGTLKVVDFGAAIAPAADQDPVRSGLPLGAIAYLSPEQARSSPDGIDARADVFGLGAILFELLSRETPHAIAGMPVQAALDAVSERTPRRLGTVNPKADRDLDAICARALATDRNARYPSARALGEDLRRFLDGLPVEARPQGLVYSMAKLARRHLRAAGLIGLVVFAVGALAVAAAVGWQQASARARELEEARVIADSMLEDLIDFGMGEADKLGADWDSRGFYAKWEESVEATGIGTPVARAKFMELFARHAGDLDDHERSIDLRMEAVQLLEQELDLAPPGTPAATNAESALALALVWLGDTYWSPVDVAGRSREDSDEITAVAEEVRALFERALALDRKLAAQSYVPAHVDNLLWSRLRLFDLEVRRDRRAQALFHLEEAALLADELLTLDPERPHSSFAKAEVFDRLFRWAWNAGDPLVAKWFAKERLALAQYAYESERDRVPFKAAYERAARNLDEISDVVAAGGGLESIQDFTPRRLAAEACARIGWWQAKHGRTVNASRSYLRAIAFFEPCIERAPEDLRWLSELQQARYLRCASRRFSDLSETERASASSRRHDDLIAGVRSLSIDPELVRLAEELILHPRGSDDFEALQELSALEDSSRDRLDAREAASLDWLIALVARRCDR